MSFIPKYAKIYLIKLEPIYSDKYEINLYMYYQILNINI